MRIHLSAEIVRGDVDQRLVDKADNLSIVGSLDVLYTLESASGNETRSTTRFGAPGNHLAFPVSDGGVGIGRSP